MYLHSVALGRFLRSSSSVSGHGGINGVHHGNYPVSWVIRIILAIPSYNAVIEDRYRSPMSSSSGPGSISSKDPFSESLPLADKSSQNLQFHALSVLPVRFVRRVSGKMPAG